MTLFNKVNGVRPDQLVKTLEHPQALGSLRSWLKLLRENSDIDPRFIPRILVVTCFSLLTCPLRIFERLRYKGLLKRTNIHPSPIIILGHWRTGTTHLQNLLCQDKRFGYVTTFQAMTPGFCLMGTKIIKPLLSWITKLLYPTRMIDNIPLSMDMPQEEEYGVANLCPYSFLHMFSFPQAAEDYFEKFVLFEDLSEDIQEEWQEYHLQVLRKATILSNGGPLVLKNPTNSGRLSLILEVFPEGKFIHLYRNPYSVYLSMVQLYKVVLPRSQLQQISWDKIEENILTFYSRLMRKYLADKKMIPQDNLVEVKFEDLETTPKETLRRLYRDLALPMFEVAEPVIQNYIDSIAGYKKNQYELTPEIIAKVNHHWGFAFDEWGYKKL